MFWIIQKNFYKYENYCALVNTLTRMALPFIEVDIDKDLHLENLIGKEKNVIICGGNRLGKIAKENNWIPGSFINKNFDFAKWLEVYQDDMLNSKAITSEFSKMESPWDVFFIRPCEDTKAFSGKVIKKETFHAWRQSLCSSVNGRFDNIMTMASPIKQIFAEYRFFVIDQNIITSSQYKSGNDLYVFPEVCGGAASFVEEMIGKWEPARAFVIDIAYTPDGYKIVEFNNINSAGFYACNVGKIIDSVETMKF